MRMVHIKDWGIGVKFVVSLSVFLFIPLVVLFAWVNANFIAYLEEEQNLTTVATVKQAEASINNTLSDVNFISKEILSDTVTQSFLMEIGTNGEEFQYAYLYALDLYLAQLLDSRDYIKLVTIFHQEVAVVQSGAYLPQDTFPALSSDVELEDTTGYWLPAMYNEAYFSDADDGYEVVFLRSINNIYQIGQSLGIEKIAIDESYICALYENLAGTETEEMFLIDQDGNIISSMNKSLLGQNITGWEIDPRTKHATEGYYTTAEGKIVSFCDISSADWILVRVDTKHAIENTTIFTTITSISILMTILFGVVFWLIQKKYIIKPIKKLSMQAENFQMDTLHWPNELTGKDEIGTLSRTFGEMVDNIQELIDTVYKTQLTAKEAQLNYLRSQINPHFLYNTLESLRWMAVSNGQDEMATQIQALAHLFAHALNAGRDMTTIGEEVAHLKDYVTIQTHRFGDRISVRLDVDETLNQHEVLHLVLQPLVENAYVHGLEMQLGQGVIHVSIQKDGNTVVYTVQDNGAGANGAAIQAALMDERITGDTVALKNIYQRIQNKYGAAYGVVFTSTTGQGTCVTVTMPYKGGE